MHEKEWNLIYIWSLCFEVGILNCVEFNLPVRVGLIANGDGFGNQSYLMIHLLTLATCWTDYDKSNTYSFSDYIYI